MAVVSPPGFSSAASRWAMVALLLAIASGFIIAVQALPWWNIGAATLSPIKSRNCFGGECRVSDLRWTTGTESWIRMGVATYAAGMIAAVVAIMCAAGIAAKRLPTLLAKMLIVAGITCAVTAGIFVVGLPTLAETSIASGTVVFAVSVALIAVAAFRILRRTDPAA
jgi:hypothetical protein